MTGGSRHAAWSDRSVDAARNAADQRCFDGDHRCCCVNADPEARRAGQKVAAYGAAAKGNTLLNYAGVRPDLLPWVVDRNPAKQGRFLPGSRIPIVTEVRLREDKPDIVLILPWNLKEEIMDQLSYIREWGGRYVTAVPALVVQA